MGWFSVQACLVIADLFVKPLMHASTLILLQTSFKSTCDLADVHLSAGAWHFIDKICLLLHREGIFDLREGVFDLSKERTEGGHKHTRCIVQQGQNLEEEENNLMKVFMGNGYPRSFICSASAAKHRREQDGERKEEGPPTVHVPYGVSEQIRRVCKNFNIRAVFKSGPTLHSLLTKMKYPHPME